MNDPIDLDLQALARPAPDRFDRRVLVGVGLADSYVRHPFAVGDLLVAFNPRGVSAIWILDEHHDEDEFVGDFESRFDRAIEPAKSPPAKLARQLDRALETGKVGDLPIDLRASAPFHQAALAQAAKIPPGEVRSYGWIAREIGRPRAARAVGTAMATNPVPIVLPCHRVVRNDGSLGNYGYGVPMKRRLLTLEGLDVAEIEALAARGVRYIASDTTGIFCLPTCRNARRITDRHRIEVRSLAEADRLGLRACAVCRPDAAG